MAESPLHRFLKYIGVLYLHDRRCRTVGIEVGPILFERRRTLIQKHEPLDRHYHIDVLGVGPKPIMKTEKVYRNMENKIVYKSQRKVGERLVTRGIEVKVSRADFRNGFICSGINYAYLLIPEGLVKKSEIPRYVGLLEYRPSLGTIDHGIKIVKRPRFQDVSEETAKRLSFNIERSRHGTLMKFIRGFVNDMRPKLEDSMNG